MSAFRKGLAWLRRPASWADEIDFVGPRRRTSVWGWALLGLGILMALQVADQASAVQDAQAEAQALLQRLGRAQRQQLLAEQAKVAQTAPAASSPQGSVPVLGKAEWRHAAQLAQWLSHDWRAMLDDVDAQSGAAHVVLTGFSLDLATLGESPGVQPELRLQAAVPDDDAALHWVQALGPQAQLRSRHALSAPFNTSYGPYAWRIEAVMGGGQP